MGVFETFDRTGTTSGGLSEFLGVSLVVRRVKETLKVQT